jgi:hypothetical protein
MLRVANRPFGRGEPTEVSFEKSSNSLWQFICMQHHIIELSRANRTEAR